MKFVLIIVLRSVIRAGLGTNTVFKIAGLTFKWTQISVKKMNCVKVTDEMALSHTSNGFDIMLEKVLPKSHNYH